MKENTQRLRHILYRMKSKVVHSSAIGKVVQKWSWKEATEADGLSIIWQQEQDAFRGHTLNAITDPVLTKRFQLEVDTWSRQTESIYKIAGDITIEPQYGLAYLPGRHLVIPTRSKAHRHVIPSLMKALFKAGRRYTHYDTVIHFDGYASGNLYHFFDDAVNPLLMLLESGTVAATLPILITEKMWNIPYVQYVLQLEPFKNLNWTVQKQGEWIKCKTLYTAISTSVQWQKAYDLLLAHTPKHPHRKIFLNRKAKFQRRLLNNDAIEALLKEAGFETIYAEDLSYPEQVALFAETSHLVAIHGAGVTNLLHSDLSRMYVLEIFSESLLHPHFYWFLELLKIKYYDGIAGTTFDINWNFRINEDAFRRQLHTMLEASEKDRVAMPND